MPRKRRKPTVCQRRKYYYMNQQKLDMINKNQLTCSKPAVNIGNERLSESEDEMPLNYPTRLMCRGKVNDCGLCNEDGQYTWKNGRIILQLVNGSWTISVEYEAIQKYVALSSNIICGLSCTSELMIQLCPSGGSTEHCMMFYFKPHASNEEKDMMKRLYKKLLQIQKGKSVQPDQNKTVTNRPPLKQIDVHHGKPQDNQNKQLPSNTSKMQKPRNRLSTVACRGKIKCFRSDPSKLPWRSGSLFIERYEGKWTLTLDYDIRQSVTQKCYELSPDTIKTVYCFTQLRLTLDFGKNSLLYFHLIPMKSVEEEKMKNVYEKFLEIQKRNPVPTVIENMSDPEDDSFNEYEIAPTQCKVLPGRISPRQHKVTSMPGRTSPMEITLNQNQDKEALEHVEISPSEMEIAADSETEIAADTETEISADAETSYIPTCQNVISTDTDSSSKVHLTQLTIQLKCSGKMKLTGEELSLPKWRDGTLRMKCVNGSWDMDLDYYVIGGGMITINYNISTRVIIKVICKSQLIVQLKPADSLPVTVRLKPHTLNDRNNMIKMFHKLLEIQRTTEKVNQPVISNKRCVSNLSHQESREDTSGKRMKTLPDPSEGLTVIQAGTTLNEELIRVLERASTKPTIIQACRENAQDLNEEDMKNIGDLCRSCKHDKILVTHGTAKVGTSAEFLAKQDLHKTILLAADNLELEADFNVGFTLGVLQCLSDRDIYIIRDGKLIHWSKMSHDIA
ncbi:uncharacterized protein LOC127717905 [Mytilus californianus]|uniref:uncharacterized protein LOC127717905 n=1 Tax=Mytilus californianus TaxID=6549 RepID=UPI0022476695|nr:uncharacterized protein LOC127717905 [Mytilus californianus]